MSNSEETGGTWVKAITIGNGTPKTRAERTPEDQKAWADRVRRIEARAKAVLLQHGAREEDFPVSPESVDISDSLRDACRSFFATLTNEQRQIMLPASRGGWVNPGTVIDLLHGATVYPDSDEVRCYDEFVPIAEAIWPPEGQFSTMLCKPEMTPEELADLGWRVSWAARPRALSDARPNGNHGDGE